MKYSIALKSLPFEPDERQVIYVENEFDERINALIKENYKQIKWIFEKSNLDFIYLPLFFNDEETKEKILYYAPYLTTEIIEKTELRSSYLLGFMSNIENKSEISPSFLYAPKQKDEEWIFQGVFVDLEKNTRNAFIDWIEYVVSEIGEELVPLQQKCERRYDEDEDDGILYRDGDAWEEDSPQVERSATPGLWSKFGRWLKKSANEIVLEEEDYPSSADESLSPTLDDIREEDIRDTVEDLERNIERLRLLGIPLAVIVEFVAKYETISRLRLTDDLRIFLPDYDNREVKMGALYKAVYFLFLNHPEGIILQHLEEYHRELVSYYLQTSQKEELTHRMVDTINRLEYPGDNTINIVLSRIKAYFKATIDEHLAKYYYIVGRPGEPYKIALSQDLIEWEDEDE